MPQRLGLTATVSVLRRPTVATNTALGARRSALGARAPSASVPMAGPSFDDEVEIAEDRHLI
jgi:hypothetical protein